MLVLLVAGGWLGGFWIWATGRSPMILDQWREWWLVWSWWNQGGFEFPRTTSGLGVVPVFYFALLWPLAALGIPPGAGWGLPVVIAAGMALWVVQRTVGPLATLMLACALLVPPGVFWLFGNTSPSWGWIGLATAWVLALHGRAGAAGVLGTLSAPFGYVLLPTWCGLMFYLLWPRRRKRVVWIWGGLAAGVVFAAYGVHAWMSPQRFSGENPVGSVVEAVLYLGYGFFGALFLQGVVIWVWRSGDRLRAATMQLIWLGAALGLSTKSNYWASHYPATVSATLLMLALPNVLAYSRARLVLACACLLVPWAPVLIPDGPVLNARSAVYEPAEDWDPTREIYTSSLSWRLFEQMLEVAGGRAVAGELLSVVEWTQAYAELVTTPGETVVATATIGPWCAESFAEGCRFVAKKAVDPEPITGQALMMVYLNKSRTSPLQIRLRGRGCAASPDSEWHWTPAGARWINQYSRWVFVEAVDVPGCAAFELNHSGASWRIWAVVGDAVVEQQGPVPLPPFPRY